MIARPLKACKRIFPVIVILVTIVIIVITTKLFHVNKHDELFTPRVYR